MKNPLPNIAAGILIGLVNEPWYAVATICLGWTLIYCLYLWGTDAHTETLDHLRASPRLRFGSPVAFLWVVASVVVFSVSLVFATLAYLLQRLLW